MSDKFGILNLLNRLKNYFRNHIDRRKTVEGIIIVIIIILLHPYINKEIHKDNQVIFDNPVYAIGKLTFFSKGTNGIHTSLVRSPSEEAYVKFKYNMNGVDYEYSFGHGQYYMPTSGLKTGDKYLVICLKTDPQLSRMLFDYPIKDSTDFVKYLEKFKKNPPPMKEK